MWEAGEAERSVEWGWKVHPGPSWGGWRALNVTCRVSLFSGCGGRTTGGFWVRDDRTGSLSWKCHWARVSVCKWIACGEQAKDTQYFNTLTTRTCAFQLCLGPAPLIPGFLLTRLSILSLYNSGWPRQCSPYQNLLGQESPLEGKAFCPHWAVPFVFYVVQSRCPMQSTHRTGLKHQLWML